LFAADSLGCCNHVTLIKETTMAKTVATILGIVLIVVGIAGFIPGMTNLMGAHLGKAHNAVHIVSGAVSLYLGAKGSLSAARSFCLLFGVIYAALGIVGFVVGEGHDHMLNLTAIRLFLGSMDHIIHIALGALYLIGGLATRSASAPSAA
jgi:uncharacterized protein DUF4383